MKPLFTVLIMLLSTAVMGQDFEVSVVKRFIRMLPLNDEANAPLQNVKDSAGRTFTVFQIITDALEDGRLKAYTGADDTIKVVSTEWVHQRITDSNGERIAINSIVLFENWHLDEKHSMARMQLVSIAPAIQGDSGNNKDITPLLYVRWLDLVNLAKEYKVKANGTRMTLQKYLEKRNYKCNIYDRYVLETKTKGDVNWKLVEEFEKALIIGEEVGRY